MKRKGLTIIFFSMIVLAATPRAMHHLQNFVAAAQSQAQVHLLNFLLSYGAPGEEAQAAPVASTEQVKAAEPTQNARPRTATQPASNTTVAQNLTGKRASLKALPAAGFPKTEGPLSLEHSRLLAEADRHYTFTLDRQQASLIVPYLNEAAKAENLKALRWLSDKKAQRALLKEFNVIVKTSGRSIARRAPVVRASMEVEAPATFEPVAGPAQKAEDCSTKLNTTEF